MMTFPTDTRTSEEWTRLSPPYRTIVADPPWYYDKINPENPGTAGHIGRPVLGNNPSRELAYSTMSVDQLSALGWVFDALADDQCRLYLWTTNRYLFDAPEVMRAWGFEPDGRVFVWCKPPMGTLSVTTEFFLTGKRGKPPRLPWHKTTWFNWPRPHHAHSQKPAAFGDLVEAWSPGPYIELFARQPRLGWDAWGLGYEIGQEGGGRMPSSPPSSAEAQRA
jgi:N6-adenosine-specific RNA methylase IME4